MSSASSLPVKVCPQCSIQAATDGAYCASCGAPYDRAASTSSKVSGIGTNLLLWGLGSIVAVIIGSLGTWVTVGPFSIGGTTGGKDGVVTLILGALAALPVGLRKFPVGAGILALCILAVGIADSVDISSSDTGIFTASIGWGLILVNIAALSLFVWSIVAFRARRRSRRGAQALSTDAVALGETARD